MGFVYLMSLFYFPSQFFFLKFLLMTWRRVGDNGKLGVENLDFSVLIKSVWRLLVCGLLFAMCGGLYIIYIPYWNLDEEVCSQFQRNRHQHLNRYKSVDILPALPS